METLRSILAAFLIFSRLKYSSRFVENLLLNMTHYLFPVSEFNMLFNDVVHDDAVFKLFEKFSVNTHSLRANRFFNQTQKWVRLVSGVLINIYSTTPAFAFTFFWLAEVLVFHHNQTFLRNTRNWQKSRTV